MTSIAFHLYQLQKIDSKIDAIGERLSKIQDLLSNDSIVVQATEEVNLNKIILNDLQFSLQEIETLIHVKRLKIEQSESSLYGGTIKNPKELQDLQKEISALKTTIQSLEEKQLNLLMQIEDQEKLILMFTKKLSEVSCQSEITNSSLNLENEALRTELHRHSDEKEMVLTQVPDEITNLYTSLRKRKNGVAVATIIDQSCSACGSTLTPSECQLAKSPTSISYCKSCNRILYAG